MKRLLNAAEIILRKDKKKKFRAVKKSTNKSHIYSLKQNMFV